MMCTTSFGATALTPRTRTCCRWHRDHRLRPRQASPCHTPTLSVESCFEELRAAEERKQLHSPGTIARCCTPTTSHTPTLTTRSASCTRLKKVLTRLYDILCRMRELAKAPGTYDGNVISPPECFELMKTWFVTTLLTIIAQAAAAKVLRAVSFASSGFDACFSSFVTSCTTVQNHYQQGFPVPPGGVK